MPRPRPSNSFTHLAGVAVHYDRFEDPQFGYGTRGKPLRFHATEVFEQKLQTFFGELWDVCPLGRAEVITSAGAFVDKPGAHGQGRGFDIDGIFWSDRTFLTLHYPQDRRFYLAVESVLRKHFGVVLSYEYDAAHRDHFHIDDTRPVGFSASSRSRVLYLQMALAHLFGYPVDVDGMAGSQTNGAARALLTESGLCTPGDVVTDAALHETLHRRWDEVLDLAAAVGFETAAPAEGEPTPLDLIENVYVVIEHELNGSAVRKHIETALTTFAKHEATADFLDQFRPDA